MNTLSLLKNMLSKSTELQEFTFHKYPSQVLVQRDLPNSGVAFEQIEEALSIRKRTGLPFWDSVMLTFFNREEFSQEILTRSTYHNAVCEVIRTGDVGVIENIVKTERGVNVALNSQVFLTKKRKAHIFLLDFHIPPGERHLDVVACVLAELGVKGFVLESGESYHFVGDEYYSQQEIVQLLGRALLFSPIVDRAWIGHQLIEGNCSVRVGYKHGVIPRVVKEVL